MEFLRSYLMKPATPSNVRVSEPFTRARHGAVIDAEEVRMSEVNALAPMVVARLGLATSVVLLVRYVVFAVRSAPAS